MSISGAIRGAPLPELARAQPPRLVGAGSEHVDAARVGGGPEPFQHVIDDVLPVGALQETAGREPDGLEDQVAPLVDPVLAVGVGLVDHRRQEHVDATVAEGRHAEPADEPRARGQAELRHEVPRHTVRGELGQECLAPHGVVQMCSSNALRPISASAGTPTIAQNASFKARKVASSARVRHMATVLLRERGLQQTVRDVGRAHGRLGLRKVDVLDLGVEVHRVHPHLAADAAALVAAERRLGVHAAATSSR